MAIMLLKLFRGRNTLLVVVVGEKPLVGLKYLTTACNFLF